ncbi:MAG: bifunctional folylpolyglutamate synthase/dihydrofolate synthase, partial [Pseudomonadota bacterium]
FRGPTLGDTARDKGGNIMPGVAAVVGRQAPEALAALEAAADAAGAPLIAMDRDFTARLENGRLVVEDERGLADLEPPRLAGAHQIENAGLAAAALRRLRAPEAAISKGMTTVEWPARLQRLKHGPLIEAAPPGGAQFWLDGGHNPHAGAALARHFADMEEGDPQPLYLICAMLNSKSPEAFLRPFAGLARRVFAAPLPGEPNALSPEDVAQAAIRAGLPAQAEGSIDAALRAITAEVIDDITEPVPRILICGSLHFAGRILRENG